MHEATATAMQAENTVQTVNPAKTARLTLRLIRASEPISRVELATRISVNRSTITEICNPLIAAGFLSEIPISQAENTVRLQGRPRVGLILNDSNSLFVGVNIGVRRTQVGIATLNNKILGETEFDTPPEPVAALALIKEHIKKFCAEVPDRKLKIIGVSIPGVTDSERRKLIYAPHLDWKNIDIAGALEKENRAMNTDFRVIVENDATAAASYEARVRLGKSDSGLLNDFVLIRSGTGIGVGMVLDKEVYRGTGKIQGLAGEFGHMTIVAGGKTCVCGNRGCWERYASASSAASLYAGDRPLANGKSNLRFLEIVKLAEAGEIRARRTLEKIGEYLGIGIANMLAGIGIPQIIISGRLVYGWKFINKSMSDAIKLSMAGKIKGWSVEPGEPRGAGLGGALEVAFDEYVNRGFSA
jgi:predicted NBD/HSP70 family sugar kinase